MLVTVLLSGAPGLPGMARGPSLRILRSEAGKMKGREDEGPGRHGGSWCPSGDQGWVIQASAVSCWAAGKVRTARWVCSPVQSKIFVVQEASVTTARRSMRLR